MTDITEDNPRVNVNGVNANALTIEDELFYVVYNGSDPAGVWINHDSQAVTFMPRGEDLSLVISDDERVVAGVATDTRIAEVVPGDRLIDGITVNARPVEPEAITWEGGNGT